MITVPLYTIAYARSGDKGAHANIGVIAYNALGFSFLQKELTAERVDAYFKPLGVTKTIRYELTNLEAFNFMLHNILDGGGSRSLRLDSQGKALGQALLQMPVEVPQEILEKIKR